MRARLFLRLAGAETRGARGRMLFVIACLAVGVAAVTAVDSMISAVEAGMRSQSRELLAADLVVRARRPLPDGLTQVLADVPGLGRTDVREVATMASSGGEGSSRLVEIKAIDGMYPFYGELLTEPAGVMPGELAEDEVLVADELASALALSVGDELRLGSESYKVVGSLLDEPDRLDFAMTLGPRVFLSGAGLERSGLLTFGSRVKYSALLRTADSVNERTLARRLRRDVAGAEYVRVETHREAQPAVRRGLARVEDYLGLVALLSLLLGGVGVAQMVRTWLATRTQSVAVLRCLGMRSNEIGLLYLVHVALLALVGSVIGAGIGLAAPFALPILAPDLVPEDPGVLWQPHALLRGLGLGGSVALLFALLPLAAIWRVPPARVLRVEAEPLPAPLFVRAGAAGALATGIFASAWAQSGKPLVALAFSVGLGLLVVVLGFGARGLMRMVSKLPRERVNPYFRHGLAALARPGAGTVGAVVALGLGTLVVVTIALVQWRLARELRGGLPAEAPSVFLVDVQPNQWAGVQAVLAEEGAEDVDSTPVAMARLLSVDGQAVEELVGQRRDGGRSRWVLTREQRLSWLEVLPKGNELLEGSLWKMDGVDEVSLEERFAQDLGATIGTRLRFDLQGVPVELTVSSIRRVDWATMRINFFVLAEPGVLEQAPHWRLAAARVEAAAEDGLQDRMAREYPNVTLLRVRPILEKVAEAISRLELAVRVLGAATILAGLAILAGAVAAQGLQRAREAALLKVLGVTRRGVALLFALEYAMVGLVAGLVGAGGAALLAWAFLEYLLELDADLPWLSLPLAALGTAALACISGVAAGSGAIRARPLGSLRAG